MGAGLFVVITGLLMFFVAERPFKFAHELIGIAFSAAVGLHVLSHWRSFSNYFFQRGAVRVLALAWSMGIGLVAASTLLTAGDAEELIVEKMNSVPLDVLAPVAGLDVTELLDRLGAAGLVVDDAGTDELVAPPPAAAGSVVNRCGGGWSAVADAPSAPSWRGKRGQQVRRWLERRGRRAVRPARARSGPGTLTAATDGRHAQTLGRGRCWPSARSHRGQ